MKSHFNFRKALIFDSFNQQKLEWVSFKRLNIWPDCTPQVFGLPLTTKLNLTMSNNVTFPALKQLLSHNNQQFDMLGQISLNLMSSGHLCDFAAFRLIFVCCVSFRREVFPKQTAIPILL